MAINSIKLMSADECRYILSLLDKEISADVISELEEDTQRDFLKDFEPVELAGYMDYTDSDDAADILNLLPVKMKEEVITSLKNKEKVAHITDLLKYDEDCAGGLMAKELIKANINWNIKQCIEEIRRQTKNVEKILTVYVVDDFGMLQGRVSLKKIILSNDDTRIKDIAVPQVHVVAGVPKENMDVVAVIHSKTTSSLLNNKAYKKLFQVDNPNNELISALTKAGVKLYVCGQSLIARGYDIKDINESIGVSVSALTILTEYQLNGYALLKF